MGWFLSGWNIHFLRVEIVERVNITQLTHTHIFRHFPAVGETKKKNKTRETNTIRTRKKFKYIKIIETNVPLFHLAAMFS